MIPECDFRRGRSTTEQISTLQQIFEKSWEHAKDVSTCFVDLGKVYGWVPRGSLGTSGNLLEVLREHSVDGCLFLPVK